MRGTTAHLRPAGGSPRRVSRLAARGRRDERGTALVEFALVAPILFLLVLGILDFGRALNYYNDLTQLAGQGARAAAVDMSPNGNGISTDSRCTSSIATNNSIQCQLVNDFTSSAELQKGITVCIVNTQTADPNTPPLPGDPVTVQTSYKFNFIPFIGNAVSAASITLTAKQSERLEASSVDYSMGCVP